MTRWTYFIAAFLAMSAVGCKSREQTANPQRHRLASLERTLERQRAIETVVADVETWLGRAVSESPANEKELAEELASDHRARLERIKPLMAKARDDRESARVLWREINDLSQAHDLGIAALATERRTREAAMVDEMAEVVRRINDYRITIASAGVQNNAEAKRRLAQLETGRRALAQTLIEVRRSSVDQWPHLHRRWKNQIQELSDLERHALERVAILPPAPSPTPREPAAQKRASQNAQQQ